MPNASGGTGFWGFFAVAFIASLLRSGVHSGLNTYAPVGIIIHRPLPTARGGGGTRRGGGGGGASSPSSPSVYPLKTGIRTKYPPSFGTRLPIQQHNIR